MSGSRSVAGVVLTVVVVGAGGAAAVIDGVAGARARTAPVRGPAGTSSVRYSIQIQAVFNRSGNPVLVANFSPDGSLATARWSICSPPPKRTCVPGHARDHALEPGPRPAGTVFRATARYLGQTYSAQVRWHGQITAHSRPHLLGQPRVGARLNPVPAIWTGGWGHEFDQLGVEACRTRNARRCVTVSGGGLGCPDHSRAVARRPIKRWYLFALDARMPADEVCAGVGYSSESALPVWPVGRTVARSAPLGPVTG
jgi:hypothetical protein